MTPPNRGATATDSSLIPARLTAIDLFSGCGGFSLGLERAGIRVLAALDSDPKAVESYRTNFDAVEHALKVDLTSYEPHELAKLLKLDHVDVIVGGPPCQGFSTARQRDGANHGERRLVVDERRYLYRHFLKFVDFFRPTVFVMENVPGIRSASGGEYFTRVQSEARGLGYRVHSQLESAWDLGVPQKRSRRLIIGIRQEFHENFPDVLKPSSRATPRLSLGAAIGDLPVRAAGSGCNLDDYDQTRRERNVDAFGEDAAKFLAKVAEVGKTTKLTNHAARPHSERDLRDFALLKEGESSAVAMARGVEFEFPYDKETFKDRFTRQSRYRPCSTIVAHLSKDGLMFIHPTQNRSLTPREAARIQSFPDWFQFPDARTHSYRLIGNAVPPLVAESVGMAIRKFFRDLTRQRLERRPPIAELRVFSDYVTAIARLDARRLRSLTERQFLVVWRMVFVLFPEIHPASYSDQGSDTALVVATPLQKDLGLNGQFCNRFARSGWPVPLEGLAKEAARRLKARRLSPHQLLRREVITGRQLKRGLTSLQLMLELG